MPRNGRSPRRNDNRSRNDYVRNDDRHYDRSGGYRAASPPRYDDRSHHGTDSWRPGDDRRNGYAPRSFRGDYPSSDSYRPQVPHGDFTFRFDKPAGVSDFPPPHSGSHHRGSDRGHHRDGRGQNRRGRARWQPPPPPSERALISGNHVGLPEERLAGGTGAKFRDLDQLSDDDELAMEISSQSSSSDTGEPSKKRARTRTDLEAAEAAPKWSNPDPYTALPCPDDTTRKKKDVVKLIRKARVEEEKEKQASTTKAEDFISFDLTDDEDDIPKPPTGPRLALPPKPPPPAGPPPVEQPPPPPPPTGVSSEQRRQGFEPRSDADSIRDNSGPLGSRKRMVNDVIKPPDYGQLKKQTMKPSKGLLLPAWRIKSNEDPCPWATADHAETTNMAFRLHKEVMDFYEYVRPRQFEQRIRDTLVENLKKALKRDVRHFGTATVHPFGSYMSGLYLPTADMDLVVCSPSFLRGGPATYRSAKSWLFKFQKFLVAQRIADHSSIEVISHARIPLVKYVDRATGLKVDVSFENLGGVEAIDTFLRWNEQYPAMPILVTLIKHYLLMRGLNEPVSGGIGGFTVICLVVSMLQLMPQVQSRSLIPEHHLGEMLLEFFDLYGRQFNHEKNAISLTAPVGYIRKAEVSTFVYRDFQRLSIVDPNNPSNDISGSSSNYPAILARFGDAYDDLRDRMVEVAEAPRKGTILECIMNGDYSSFRMQREYLRHVHEKQFGPCSD